NVSVHRVWMHIPAVLKREERSNEIMLIQDECDRYHEYFAKLKAAGIKRIMVMNHRSLYPYGYKAGTSATVPDPVVDFEIYAEWLKMYEESYRILATEFPEVSLWECGNEFDLSDFMHKSEYYTDKVKYSYAQDEAAWITADMCYAARKGLRSVSEKNHVVLPGMSQYAQTLFLEEVYNGIESKKLPTVEEYYVTDPDEYFDVLAWHCYPINKNSSYDKNVAIQDYKQRCLDMYDVAKRHGDGDKRVWITEIGVTETQIGTPATKTTQEKLTEYMIEIIRILREDLSFVETCFWFRLANYDSGILASEAGNGTAGIGECYFGMFYSPDDKVNRGKPKPQALAYFKLINGDDADVSPLYWYSDQFGVKR
ncbi:MAG: hypothetical protein IJB97_03390, partial [Clostridia bacterium]|nr:hypothetical protein [Clostridia bacterium]